MKKFLALLMIFLVIPFRGGKMKEVIYVGSFDGYFYAINNDGSLRWKISTGEWIYTKPFIDKDGDIYFGADGDFLALHPDGSIKWDFSNGYYNRSSSIADSNTIYFGSNSQWLYALYKADGSVKWQRLIQRNIESPVLLTGTTLYFVTLDSYLYAYGTDGTYKWRYSTSGSSNNYSFPALGLDGTIYVGGYVSGKNILLAINPNGTLKWTYSSLNVTLNRSAVAVTNNRIYVSATPDYSSYYLVALDTNAIEQWRYLTDSRVSTTPTVGTDGTIYFGTYNGYVYALNPNGTLKWSYNTGNTIIGSAPVIGSDGTIYIGNAGDNYLYAFNPNGTLKWRYLTGGSIQAPPSIGLVQEPTLKAMAFSFNQFIQNFIRR